MPREQQAARRCCRISTRKFPSLDDEMQRLQSDATDLCLGGRTILTQTLAQTTATEAKISTLWPPVIED